MGSSRTDKMGYGETQKALPRRTDKAPALRSGVPADSTSTKVVLRRGPDNTIVFLALRVVTGRDMFRSVTLLEGSEVLIGRGDLEEDGSFALTDASVSRLHARVTRSTSGEVEVEDLNSTNGTAINGVPIRRAPLQVGDQLEVGGVCLRLETLSTGELVHLENVLLRLEASNRDPLTGLLTRVWLEEELPRLTELADAEGEPITCLFVDIDHFKSINDRFGHPVGDDVLMGVARLLMVGVREADACVRYGGEELVLFLGGASEAVGAEVAGRMRASIQGHDWPRTVAGLAVTVSVGVAERRENEGIKEWIVRADRALYAAKGSGRNRVALAGK